MIKSARRCYEFGPFRLDPGSRALWRGADLVRLTPKAFDTLLVLVERRGEIVGRAEIVRAVWPDCFVAEGNLNSNIFMLRCALGEARTDRQFVATIPRRGYRFVAEVRETSGAAMRGGEDGAIAVLPFKSLGGADPDDGIGTGMADAISSRLSRLSRVTVRPTSAVMKFRGGDVDALAAGRELGVGSVVEGSIRRAGDRLRVTVQCVGVSDGAVIWAEQFDEQAIDLFAAEDLIAARIARKLAAELFE